MPKSIKIKKNLLVVLLGGTIGSEVSEDGKVSLAGSGFEAEFFEALDKRFNYKVIAPLSYSSENATIDVYRKALREILEEAGKGSSRYKGILILHGTDSMAFFAQLAVRCLSHLKMPVIITGAKRPKNDPKTDAVKNIMMSLGILAAAVKDAAGPRTFGVVYEDSLTRKPLYVSAQDAVTADINGDMRMFCDRSDPSSATFKKKGKSPFASEEYKKRTAGFLVREEGVIITVPSVPNTYVPQDVTGCSAVLIECYHSGTQDNIRLAPLTEACRSSGIPCYMGPVPVNGNIYESRKALEDMGCIPLSGMPFEGCWAEVVIDHA